MLKAAGGRLGKPGLWGWRLHFVTSWFKFFNFLFRQVRSLTSYIFLGNRLPILNSEPISFKANRILSLRLKFYLLVTVGGMAGKGLRAGSLSICRIAHAGLYA